MAYPDAYFRQFDFQSYQNANPNRPLPGDKVNADLNAVAAFASALTAFLQKSIRDDGLIQNGTISRDQLTTDVLNRLGDTTALDTATAGAAASATAAATSETNAANSAAAASISATNAASSATAAGTSATNAASSATAAAVSATAAAASATVVTGNKFSFDTTTTMADPGGPGNLRFNNATVASVTQLAFDNASAETGNPDISAFLATWGASTNAVKGTILIRKIGAPATFAIFSVNAAVTNNTTWLQVPVTYVIGNGLFSAADALSVQFARSGDAGGVTNIAGNTGAFTLSHGLTNSVNDIQVDGAFGFRNRLVNPTGQIAQITPGSTADVGHTGFDQWYALTQTAAVAASLVSNAENGTPFMMRLTQSQASAQRFGLAQALETADCIDLRGKTVTLSARVRMSASTTLRYAIVEWTGTADSPTRDVVLDWTNGTFTAGNFFTSTSTVVTATGSIALTANTLTSISLSGTVGSSMNNIAVFFWTDSTQAQNVTLDIGKVQLEVGSKPSNYSGRPFIEELARCQRWYAKTFPYSTSPAQNAGLSAALQTDISTGASGLFGVTWAYPGGRMRLASPTITTFNPSAANANWRDSTNGADRTVAAGSLSDMFVFIEGSGGVASTRNFIHVTADARLTT